jgi:drug/metabolite transporter (DMT)-like permease
MSRPKTSVRLQADLQLLLVAIIWGSAFVPCRIAAHEVGTFLFNGLRFLIGAVALVIFIRPDVRRLTRAELWGGALIGVIAFSGSALQQAGLQFTTAGKAGFITGLYVVMVPILGLAVGQLTRRTTWLGAGLAAIGLYYLSVTESLRIGPGDLLVLACAVGWAVHVLVVAHLAPRGDPVQLACVQFALTAALSALAAAAWESVRWEALTAAAGPILYGGLCSVGIGYTLQVVGQRHAPPAHAAILLSGESLFAVLGGAWFLGESLTGRETLGCVLMFGGIIVSQVRRRSRAVCRELSEPA